MVNHERSIDFENAKVDTISWRVAPYFLVQKDIGTVEKNMRDKGLGWEDFYLKIPSEERERIAWDRKTVDDRGYFEFAPNTLILAQTIEDILVPQDRIFIMQSRFFSYRTGLELSLTTNLSAPFIHPGDCGPQTFEIFNEGLQSLRLDVSDLICRVDVIPLDSPLVPNGQRNGQFTIQGRGQILVGSIRL